MIRSFVCAETRLVFEGKVSRKLAQQMQKTALRKLMQLDAVMSINDLRVPPGNHLEALAGDRVGQHSIRINDQWRLCFRWTPAGVQDVEIVDYH
jgi:toxin HigB-1